MGHRRKAREYALQGLYMYEMVNKPMEGIVSLDWLDGDIPGDIRVFAVTLLKGTLENIDHIDSLIKKFSKNWKFERINVIDKSILRLSIYAMLFLSDIPIVVSIDEGIELGKMYGGENSGQFINGILDAIKRSESDNVAWGRRSDGEK
jgi:N utilization substance protein B